MQKRWLGAVALGIASVSVQGSDLWGSVKDGVSGLGSSVSKTASSLTSSETPEQTRVKIDSMAQRTLERLFTEVPQSQTLYEQAAGYAVFDTRKFSFLITSGFGAGVLIDNASGSRTYMKMATGGANVGMGAEFHQLVFLFEKPKDLADFVAGRLETGSEASATAGTVAEGLSMRFVDGVAVYKLTESGLKLTLDITGTRYWKDDTLNP